MPASPTTARSCSRYRVATTPASRVFSYVDYWGTRVDVFGIAVPHTRLEVLVEATVQTRETGPLTACPRLASLRDPDFLAEHQEYLEPSPHTEWGEPLRRDAEIRAGNAGDDVVGAVLALHRAVGDRDHLRAGQHLRRHGRERGLRAARPASARTTRTSMVAMCRSVGIPARYVSGYSPDRVRTARQDGDADTAEVTTHAWIEVAIPGAGWWGSIRRTSRRSAPRT